MSIITLMSIKISAVAMATKLNETIITSIPAITLPILTVENTEISRMIPLKMRAKLIT